jgi:hypothetical protein
MNRDTINDTNTNTNTMNDDFGTTLTALLDDVAAGIEPRGDFEAVRDGHVALVTNGGDTTATTGSRFRRTAAIAAASVMLIGGGVAAYRASADDGSLSMADDVTTTASPTTKPHSPATTVHSTTPPTTEHSPVTAPPTSQTPMPIARSAQLAGVTNENGTVVAKFVGTAPAGEQVTVTTPFGSATATAAESGEWYALATLAGAPAGDTTATVTFSGGPDAVTLPVTVPAAPVTVPQATTTTLKPVEPAPTTVVATTTVPKPPPAAVEFTATLGWSEGDGTPLDVGLWGKAAPGATVTASSSAGSGSTTAGNDGHWEMVLRLDGLAPGARAGIRVSNSASTKVVERSARAPEAPKPFTAQLGSGDLASNPMKQTIVGTGPAGSTVRAESVHGAAEAVIGTGGNYEMRINLYDVPVGSSASIRVTNSAGGAVDLSVTRQAPPTTTTNPPAVGFTANAAFTECGAVPPYNDYSGTAPAGATISVSSAWGSGSTTAGSDGKWALSVTFPDAPVGQFFDVTVSSSSGGSYTFPFRRV